MKLIGPVNEKVRERAVNRCRELGVVIPTLGQMKNPDTIPAELMKRLPSLDMQAVDPGNLFRITWKNDPETGLFHNGNYVEFPSSITGVDARLIGLVGRHFPTGSHKVGAGFGCLVPRLVTGEFDPTTQKAVWPSTGNFCRGGAFDCALLGCTAVAILPEGMSPERFEWLEAIGSEIIRTPGTESNVKEIFDECNRIRANEKDHVIFNQFEEFGNSLWHYQVTGSFAEEVFRGVAGESNRLAAFVSATGSAGTIAAGDFLKSVHPHLKVTAVEALPCPTLLYNGFGEHGIEGIGDKHVPWIHNLRTTDFLCGIDDEQSLALLLLFNHPEGARYLKRVGVSQATISRLPLLGISGICNLVASIKTARYFELDSDDIVLFPMTDSVDLYHSRVAETDEKFGGLDEGAAARIFGRYLEGIATDHVAELGYRDRKRIHNLKYFTWVEQQGRSSRELDQLWDPSFWVEIWDQASDMDRSIEQFNDDVGL